MIHVISVVVALLLVAPAKGDWAQSQRFYERSEEGWFWYLERVEPEDKESEIEDPPAPTESVPDQVAEATPEPGRMTVAWIEENLDTYMRRAIDDPTPENVRAYLLIQKIGLEKAHKFTEVAQRVIPGDPLLDNVGARPNSTVGNRAAQRQATEARRRLLAQIWQEAGIAFFFDPACSELCARQASILQKQSAQYGLTVMAVSVDGAIPPVGFEPSSFVADQGQADMLGVKRGVPGIFMLKPPDLWVPIAQGFVGEADLQARTIMAAAEAGWITEEEVDSTRGIRRDARSIVAGIEGMEMPSDPDKVVEILNNLAGGEFQ